MLISLLFMYNYGSGHQQCTRQLYIHICLKFISRPPLQLNQQQNTLTMLCCGCQCEPDVVEVILVQRKILKATSKNKEHRPAKRKNVLEQTLRMKGDDYDKQNNNHCNYNSKERTDIKLQGDTLPFTTHKLSEQLAKSLLYNQLESPSLGSPTSKRMSGKPYMMILDNQRESTACGSSGRQSMIGLGQWAASRRGSVCSSRAGQPNQDKVKLKISNEDLKEELRALRIEEGKLRQEKRQKQHLYQKQIMQMNRQSEQMQIKSKVRAKEIHELKDLLNQCRNSLKAV